MSANAFGSSGGSNGSFDESSSSKTETHDPLTPILEATLSQGKKTLTHEEWDRLATVAREGHEGDASMEDWSVALVRELLETRLPQEVLATQSLDHMSRMIASTLCGDPASKKRLIELRSQLLGGQS